MNNRQPPEIVQKALREASQRSAEISKLMQRTETQQFQRNNFELPPRNELPPKFRALINA